MSSPSMKQRMAKFCQMPGTFARSFRKASREARRLFICSAVLMPFFFGTFGSFDLEISFASCNHEFQTDAIP